MRNVLFVITIILLLPCSAYAQENLNGTSDEEIAAIKSFMGEPDAYMKALRKLGNIAPEGAVNTDCHPPIFSVILEFKDSKIQAPLFSDKVSQAFKDFITNNLKNFETLPWEIKIPGVKGLKNFKIFWMHCYVLDVFHSGEHPWLSFDMIQQITNALTVAQRQGGSQLFIAPPYCVFISPTIYDHTIRSSLNMQADSLQQVKGIADRLVSKH